MQEALEEYLRPEMMPHMWCPGCGNGIVVHCLIRALYELGLPREKTVVVAGIGCAGRSAGYLNLDTVHTTHGRALAFATGIKLASPGLTVVVLMGDGDAAAIGGNHLIHAARRDVDLTAVVFNNNIYGMTGGQHSPLTPAKAVSTTMPGGTGLKPFDLPQLARGAGAGFVGRSTTFHHRLLTSLIRDGIGHSGFALVEAVTYCPTAFGRQNKMGSPAEGLRWQKNHFVEIDKFLGLPEEDRKGMEPMGLFYPARSDNRPH
ncbi:MAG: thiamine pyrophosphate-dependent enzyme [Peptococcaceae bacterium]|jgi:2-oxoglutarate ferredoxin oxidoreductase subunit beta|nr:thiamine pyrophosphate-dependent enzyme [Peptococcaceae bacterium]